MKFWKPKTILRLEGDKPASLTMKPHSAGELFMAWVPYLLLVVFVLPWGDADIKLKINTWTHNLLPAWVPSAPRQLNRLLVPGLHNAHHADAAGHEAGRAVRRAVRVELAERVGHGLLPRGDRDGDRAAREAGQFVKTYVATFKQLKMAMADDRVDARPRLPDELLGHDVHAGTGARGDRRRVSVLQRRRRLAGRVPDRQRHVGERAVRQPAGRHGATRWASIRC